MKRFLELLIAELNDMLGRKVGHQECSWIKILALIGSRLFLLFVKLNKNEVNKQLTEERNAMKMSVVNSVN